MVLGRHLRPTHAAAGQGGGGPAQPAAEFQSSSPALAEPRPTSMPAVSCSAPGCAVSTRCPEWRHGSSAMRKAPVTVQRSPPLDLRIRGR